jgi:hypothetical protein
MALGGKVESTMSFGKFSFHSEAAQATILAGIDRLGARVAELEKENAQMMTEQRAREILGDSIKSDDDLLDRSQYLSWRTSEDNARLDSSFTADELEAIAWWMKNKRR